MVDDGYGLRLSQTRPQSHLGANPQPKNWLPKTNSFWKLSPSLAGRGSEGLGGNWRKDLSAKLAILTLVRKDKVDLSVGTFGYRAIECGIKDSVRQPPLEFRIIAKLFEKFRIVLHQSKYDGRKRFIMFNSGILQI